MDLSREKAPSSPTLRQRLDAATCEWDDAVLQANTRLLKKEANIKPSACGYVLLSFDVSPMDNSDSHKEGVSWTYKKFDGYARNFRKGIARRRIKSVIQDLIYMACRLVFRSNRFRILLGADCPYFEAFSGLYYRWT